MNSETPVVSVVIPCYNMGNYLSEAVESALSQSFQSLEVIVVDDGSDDPGTKTVLERIERRGISVLRTVNRGVAAARNHAIRAARGRYILPLDADDLLDPTYLAKAVPLLEADPELTVVSCDAELTGAASGVLRLPDFSPVRVLSQNLLFATSLFRKTDWERGGGYCTRFRHGWEDWDFWIALSRRPFRVARVPEALFRYRIRSTSRDRSMTFVQKAGMVLLILARHWSSYLRSPASLLHLVRNSGPQSGK